MIFCVIIKFYLQKLDIDVDYYIGESQQNPISGPTVSFLLASGKGLEAFSGFEIGAIQLLSLVTLRCLLILLYVEGMNIQSI
jgi:hypothetical protein